MKAFVIAIFIVLFALVTFFGIGPVLLADGSMMERMWTLVVVVVIYLVLGFVLKGVLAALKRRQIRNRYK
ncbi:DUF6954 family protein [Paenibacillus koleovorans]|uniref:DUF6954 family protein n=1 Tax=Paenibacillus koleovorans TaxID=121608 RepID=UPI000FDA9DBD|nr:hypothetical protein [Paenibacillus koleovorans]